MVVLGRENDARLDLGRDRRPEHAGLIQLRDVRAGDFSCRRWPGRSRNGTAYRVRPLPIQLRRIVSDREEDLQQRPSSPVEDRT